MDKEDWKMIRRLKIQYMGTSRGIALGNLIAEKQRLDQVREIVNNYDGSMPSMICQFAKLQRILEKE